MATYATLAQAKAHLRITDTAHDADVQLKLDQAEAMVVDFVEAGRTRHTDPSAPAPGSADGRLVQAMILILLAHLYEHRGDDLGPDEPDTAVWDAITRTLARLRDPALA